THAVHRWRTVSPRPGPGALAAVSCFAPDTCMTIRTRLINGTPRAFSQFWNGRRWGTKLSPLPHPAGFLSCPSIRSGTAVGTVLDGCELVDVAEHWNGFSWSEQQLPPPPIGTTDVLVGLSCPAANSCTAIGSYHGKRGPRIPIAERWNGKTWTFQ